MRAIPASSATSRSTKPRVASGLRSLPMRRSPSATYACRTRLGRTSACVTDVSVTLTAGTPTTNVYPGGSADVRLAVSNPNFSPVRIGSLALDTTQGTAGFAVDAGHSGCGLASLGFSTQNNSGAGWTVNAKVGGVNGTLDITLVNGLSMGTGAANACQGASFTVYLTAGPSPACEAP